MIDLADLCQATNGILDGLPKATEFSAFAYDSRRLQPGQLFVAVQTPTGDGHDFIGQAIERGASGILCQRISDLDHGHTLSATTIIVPNTQNALVDYARFIVSKHQPRVIGVTGSNGKTTTKEAIAMVLASRYRVFKNPGSYNGRFGLPIALGQLTADHEIAILEMACDGFGEIAAMASWTKPLVGVMTTVSSAHLAGLGSVENVAREKSRLIESLPPNGTAVLNADDIRVASASAHSNAPTITYGLSPTANLQVIDIDVGLERTRFTLCYTGRRYSGQVNLIGQHQLYPVLAAVATGLAFDIDIETSLAALAELHPMPGRLQSLVGKQGSTILDDTYNANVASVIAAVDTLATLGKNKTRLAVLGKMADLGAFEAQAHAEVGQHLAGKIDRLIGVGEGGQMMAQAAISAGLDSGAVEVVYSPSDAVNAILPHLSADTMVLAKASAVSRLERIVAQLLADPDADTRRLARSETGWEHVRIGMPRRPTWVEVDLDALGQNVRCLTKLAGDAKLMAVLKADAYGHGAVQVARTALSNGASWLAVATLEEGLVLRHAGIDAPILVLGYLPAWQAGDAIRNHITATIFSRSVLVAFSDMAQHLQMTANVHIKVDTGMGRLGLLPTKAVPFIKEASMPGVEIEGLFTHFGQADEADLAPAQAQLAQFNMILAELDSLNLRPPLVHASNTAAILNMPEARFDMVRAGTGLYGLAPSSAIPLPDGMQPVLSFKTTIAQVKTLPPDSAIGYGATYRTQGEETIAIIPVGYADGFRRGPQTWTDVLVKGQCAPLVGRVSMDQSAINVSHIPHVRQGDEVVLIGQQGSQSITAEDVATRLGTINYEVVSEILARVPRMT